MFFYPPADSLPVPHIPDDLTIPQFFLSAAHPERPQRPSTSPWLIEDHSGRTIYLDELRARTAGLANALSIKWNLGEDQVACLFSPNHVDYPVCLWATHTLGAIITPANPSYTASELAYQLEKTKAAMVFVHSDFLSTAKAAAQEVGLSADRILVIEAAGTASPHLETVSKFIEFGSSQPRRYVERKLSPGEGKRKVAFYSFSSGTTGKPKVGVLCSFRSYESLRKSQAVVIPHYSVLANVLQKVAHFRLNDPNLKKKHTQPGDVGVAVLPFYHIYGLVVTLHYMLFAGVTLVVVPKFNFTEFLESIVKYKVNQLLLVPPQIVLLCKHPASKKYDLSHVKLCSSGAAPLSGELMNTVKKVLPNAAIGQGYGLTETATTISFLGGKQEMGTVGSAGQLVPGVVARVERPDGSLCKEGEQGELFVKSPSIPLGYLDNEKATKETYVDGWVRTGDEVIIKDSEIYIVDRLKVKGFQVAPAELEGHLLMHPWVVDSCVVGVPDDYSGELPLAFVVLQPEIAKRAISNPGEIKSVLKKHVSDDKVAYKHLNGGIIFIEAIPKTPSGKILRRVLRDEARAIKKTQAKL
ncbi:unnamed protein product [Mycena citricolor]|uniref:Phenylacetyl-CoA ligase n=1 Tax=Mycena citricolor TaxID=2018698 RepID=A0AAD2K5S7_9AGAR|nr:unnamed protein product [Mycena citricolor]